ncbi:uncharacterized protein LOC127009632 isoform X2 [Eriocheir sinensis]|uniref:uncharacterized protein LOC127009632 isoform X2 n=1 Tax=Eriocheir sinensis TaxID=95602 RepID=UPI0021C7FB1D|nr:uncharacterized protein LOC127009632 isoform X2 [Eriocheir sinensis]
MFHGTPLSVTSHSTGGGGVTLVTGDTGEPPSTGVRFETSSGALVMSQVKTMPDAMAKGEEAACSSEVAGRPVNQPLPRRLKVTQKETGGIQPTKTLRVLAKISLVLAGVIFFCQVAVAACLCRPVVVMGGVWVGALVLVQAVLGLRAPSSHALLVGHAWVSGAVCLVCVAAAAYLFSGHLTLACISAFHRPDHASVVRLYVVEVVGLVACLPCLAAAVICLLAAALSARAACPPKPKREAPFVLYLPRWGGEGCYGSGQPGAAPPPAALPNHQPSTSAAAPASQDTERAGSPPPSYNQVAEESYA